MTIEQIHDSNVNGQLKQLATQIEQYGAYDFFHEYGDYVVSLGLDDGWVIHWFKRATLAHIRNNN